jgi:5,10-methylenetetrahydromethanopterin reductase
MWSPADPVGELPLFADRVDGLGYDELWLAEDCFAHGAMSAAAMALTRMPRSAVGIGLLPVGMRHPALAAMEIATLAHLYPGRLRVAFGHGVESWMQQIGARPQNRITFLREVADAAVRLVRGEEVTRDAGIALHRVRLDQAPEQTPQFMIGTTGSRGVEVAAELGLGLLMPEGTGVDAVRWARARLPARSPVTIYSWLSIADEQDEAEKALLAVVREWRARELYPRLYAFAGLPPAAEVNPEMLESVAVVGDAERCARRIEALHHAGADAVVFLPVGGDPLSSLARVRHEVVPLLAAVEQARSPEAEARAAGTLRREHR